MLKHFAGHFYSFLQYIATVCRVQTLRSGWHDSPRKNVLVALECSTLSTLMDAAAFKKLGQPDWLEQAAAVASICILVAAWNAFVNCVSGYFKDLLKHVCVKRLRGCVLSPSPQHPT